jgi:cytochrome P450/NADPH-cytochrome P450 reductase
VGKIATQLMLKWERLNADDTVEVAADMTRLTRDTIALCCFDYRFNSFHRDTSHPFVLAMVNKLEAAQAVARGLSIKAKLRPGRAKKVRADPGPALRGAAPADRTYPDRIGPGPRRTRSRRA